MCVTIRDVARKAGVSIATVSYIINDKKQVTPETKKKVLDTIKELNYLPNYNARGLAKQKTNLIGILIPYWNTDQQTGIMFDNPFYSELVRGIERVTSKNNYHLLLVGSNQKPEIIHNLIVQRYLDGLIVIGAYSELLFYLKKTDLPFILVDSYLQDDTVYSVGIDDRYGGYIATKYLLESGHRRIGLLTGELLDNGVYMERFKGYRRALEEKGLRVDDKNIYETETSFRGGYEGVDKLLDQNNSLTGIFSTADIISVGVLKKLKEMEVSVPDDLSLISFDDNPFAEFLYPALTTINQSIIIKGSCAAKLLMDVINNKEIDEKKLNYRLS
mgnify:FL=1